MTPLCKRRECGLDALTNARWRRMFSAKLLMIRAKRIYDEPEPSDGDRFLVDRLWPRGVKKDAARIVGWIKTAAPSDALRKWYGHDPAKWDEFQKRYFAELEKNPEAWQPLLETARKRDITLLFGKRDIEHNNAVALKMFLERQIKAGGRRKSS